MDDRLERPPQPRGTGAIARAVAAFVVLLAALWTAVGALAAPLLPGGGKTAAALAVLLTAVPLATLVAGRSLGLYPGALVRLLVFRPFWYAQFAVLLLAPVGILAAIAGLPFGMAGEFGRAALAAAAALLAVLLLVGYLGSRRLEVRRLTALLPRLPAALDGLTIGQLSDLHVGPHSSRPFLERAARAVRDAAPDLIAVTGDLVDDFPPDLDRYAEIFGDLRAPLGVYAVPGNHEVYTGWPEVRSRLERLPLTVLDNRSVAVRCRGQDFAVVGTGDPAFGPGAARPADSGDEAGGDAAAPDIRRALSEVAPGTFVIALAHNPALWPELAARGADFTLSGHTHWGQLAFPKLGWCLASPFLELAMGAHSRGNSLLYIHPGSNYWGLPFRLGQASQVAIITLRRGDRTGLLEE